MTSDEEAIAAAAAGDAIAQARMRAELSAGKPLAHILGKTTFLGVTMRVSPGVLAPRAETEVLAQAAIDWLGQGPRSVLDLCCGSGNLACAIAVHVPEARVVASDLTHECVALASENVRALGLQKRVDVVQGDLFEPLSGRGPFDAIVCNPPYISTGRLDKNLATLLTHEPREAFDGGPYGMRIQQQVARDARKWLRRGGLLGFEIGEGQARQVELVLARAGGYSVARTVADAAGAVRALFITRED